VRLYLDDDLDSNTLMGLLRRAGHEVVSPRAAGTRGATDEDHLGYATTRGLVLLTAAVMEIERSGVPLAGFAYNLNFWKRPRT